MGKEVWIAGKYVRNRKGWEITKRKKDVEEMKKKRVIWNCLKKDYTGGGKSQKYSKYNSRVKTNTRRSELE